MACGIECAAAGGSFGDDDGIGDARYYTVTLEEIALVGELVVAIVLGNECPALFDDCVIVFGVIFCL